MKFSIAAKLGLLAALVSLVATGLVGWWAFEQGRRVLTQHEMVDLADETELRVYELMNDFRYLRKDVRELANPTSRGKDNPLDTPRWIADLIGGENGSPRAPEEKQGQS